MEKTDAIKIKALCDVAGIDYATYQRIMRARRDGKTPDLLPDQRAQLVKLAQETSADFINSLL